MAGNGSLAVFELYDGVAAGLDADILGLWATPAATPEAGVAFGAPIAKAAPTLPAQPGGAPLWRANYPDDPALAATGLDDAYKKLQTSQSALTLTPYRLDSFVAQRQAGMAPAFPAPGAGPLRPEDELALLLPELQAGGPVVFGGPLEQIAEARQRARDDWRDARRDFQTFSARLQQMIGSFAYVETRVAGELVGRTRVSWSGDLDTGLQERISLQRMRLHSQTVDAVLESRRALLRTSTTIIGGALTLSLLLSSPLGFVAAFPAVLRFIRRLREQLENAQD
jgi:hypothetical protein